MGLYRHGHRARLRAALLASTALVASAAAAHAETWLASPGSSDFSTAANWSPATVPTAVATFDNSSITTLTFSGSRNIDAFEFNAGAPAYTFNMTSGFGVAFHTDGIVNNSSNAPTFNVDSSPLRFEDTSTAGNAIINLQGGTVQFLGSATAGTAQLNAAGGTTFDFTGTTGPSNLGIISAGSISGAGNFDLGSNQLIVGSNNLSTNVSGTISGNALTKVGTGTLTLSGPNTYTGGTTISGGAVAAAHETGGVVDALGTGPVTLDGGKQRVDVTGDLQNAVTFTNNKTSVLSAATGQQVNVVNSVTLDAGTIAQFGDAGETGTVVLSGGGTADATSAVVVAGGTLKDGGNASITSLTFFAASTTVAAGAVLDFNDSFNQAIRNLKGDGLVLTGAGGGTTLSLFVDDGTVSTFGGVISGAGGVMVQATAAVTNATMVFTGDNTYTGGTIICDCTTLQLGDGGTTGSIVGDVANGGTLIFNRSNTLDFTGNISDDFTAGKVVQFGTGMTIFSGTNTYSGGTTITAGTVRVMNDSSVGTGDVTLNGGTFQAGANGLDFTNTFLLNPTGGAFDTNGHTLTISGNVTDGTGPGALTKTGAGTLVLSGTNTYTGATNVNAGTLQIDSDFALPETTDMKVNAGATLQIGDGVFADINSLADGPSGGGAVKIGTSDPSTTLFIGFNGGATTTFSGAITGPGSMSLDGGQLTLTGASSIGGDLTICDCSTLTITGYGASFVAAGDPFGFVQGTDVSGTLKVLNGAAFQTGNLLVGGSMTVDGANTTATATGLTFVGPGFATADLTISGGAVMNSELGAIIENPLQTATVTVTGQSSVWNVGNFLTVGNAFAGGPGYLTIVAGGVVNVTGGAAIGADLSLNLGPSIVSVTGTGSAFNVDDLQIGQTSCICGDMAGTLTVADGGKVTVTGTTNIAPLGVLNLGIGGLAGSIIAPAVVNDGQIVANFTDTLTLAADVSGLGSLAKSGAGTLTLTGTNTYTGATTIDGGMLVLGNGGTAGSITGNVTANAGATFGVNRSDIYALPNLVTGAGNFAQLGPGTTVLGLNGMSYTGTTTIAAGVLQVGQGGSEGSIGTGEIINNATLAINKSSNFTLPNNILGAGIFNQIGTGTTVLMGTSTYSGATNVNAGVLQAGAVNTFSPNSTHNVASGATLDLNNLNQTIGALSGAGPVALGSAILTTGANNASTTYSGDMSGIGGLTKTGTGVFTLSGTNTFTGPTNVNGGTLAVNGSIAGPVTVNGGTLGGTGTVGSTTINAGGSLSPGNSIGTISIAGNLNFVGAGNYIVEVSPAAADRTNASGSATLSGTLQAIGTGGVYTVGARYTVINATGGVSGTFGKLAISGNFGVTKPRVDYDGNNVYLVLDPNSVTSVLVNPTSDQRSLAGAIDAAVAAGSTAAPFAALFALPVTQIPAALDQLTGEVHASAASVLVDESLYMRSAVLGRLRQASYGGDTGMASLALGGPQTSFQDEAFTTLLAYGGKSPVVGKAPMRAPQAGPDVVFWAQGFGAWGRFDGDGNAVSVRRDLAGFFTGVDTRVGANGRAGVAAGYSGSKNVLNGRGSANVDTGHIAAYGGWSFGALNLRAGGGYAFHTIDTDRTVNFAGFFDRTFAHYQGGTGQAFGEVGYGFNFANVAVEPFAGGAWVRLSTDATAERGGLAALNVVATTFEVGYSTLGIRAASIVPLADNMMLVPRVSLAWQHAFGSVTPEATLAFQVAPVPFAISGVPIARDALLAEAGVDLAIGAHATLGVSYTGQIAHNVTDHAAKGKFTWRF